MIRRIRIIELLLVRFVRVSQIRACALLSNRTARHISARAHKTDEHRRRFTFATQGRVTEGSGRRRGKNLRVSGLRAPGWLASRGRAYFCLLVISGCNDAAGVARQLQERLDIEALLATSPGAPEACGHPDLIASAAQTWSTIGLILESGGLLQ